MELLRLLWSTTNQLLFIIDQRINRQQSFVFFTFISVDHQQAAISFISRIATNSQIQWFKTFEELEKRKSFKTISTTSVDSVQDDPLIVHIFNWICSFITLTTITAQKRLKNCTKTIWERMGFGIDPMKREKEESYQNLLEPTGCLEKNGCDYLWSIIPCQSRTAIRNMSIKALSSLLKLDFYRIFTPLDHLFYD